MKGSDNMLIKTKDISKYYKIGKDNFAALDGINLEIDEGEFVAIQGTSGAGKSTLLHILGCLDSFDKGTYYFDGIDLSKMNDKKKAKFRNEKIGFVMQDFSLINHKKVGFNVMLPMYFNSIPIREMHKKAHQALRKVGIEDQFNKKVNQLSGGQRQRVAIARAIVNNPSVILADEPTGALDTKTSAEIMELFKKLNEDGKTIIIITHDMEVAAQCKRKIEISDGKIVNSNSTADKKEA